MLTSKQKKMLRGLANSLHPLVLIGKEGLSTAACTALKNALESHELVKVKLLKSALVPVQQAALDLSAATHSEVVGIIGKTIIFYRRAKKPVIVLDI